MKKLFHFLLAIQLIIVLTGCCCPCMKSTEQKQAEQNKENTESTQKAE